MLNLQIALDPSTPGAFMATYRQFLGDLKPRRTEALMSTAERLLGDYRESQHELEIATEDRAKTLRGWLEKRKEIKKAKQRLFHFRQKLMSWITTTLDFFRSPPSLMSNTL